MLRRIAYVGTGGTISSLGTDAFDLLDYGATDIRVSAEDLIARSGLQGQVADIVPVNFRQIDSTAITHQDWADLAAFCVALAEDPTIQGIVIGHGTASLEETAFLLSLILDLPIPVVLTGSMRPLSGISIDAYANLAGAMRTAVAIGEGRGVLLVVLNDEIHAPRHVTKGHNLGLGAFHSPAFGPLGHVVGSMVTIDRQDARKRPSRFTVELIERMPRVDIIYSHVGADGALIQASIAAGAKGIVSAGFGPGMASPPETEALRAAIAAGLTVVQSSRVGPGRVVDSAHLREVGAIAGSDLGPQKARILLSLCLARGDAHDMIADLFRQI